MGFGLRGLAHRFGDVMKPLAVGFNCANARSFAHMVEGVKIIRTADDKRQHIGVTRKFASAMIAKIPLSLSRHIGRTFYPSTRAMAA